MSRNTSTSNRTMRNKFGSTLTNGLSQVLANQQLQTYTGHYGGKWVGKKRDFLIMQYTRTRVLEASGTSWLANLQN